ncbi:MAG: FAD-binding protein [Alphaproteobacteria bacterium]|nr:FAD-binding protein [Alphaproteobacteria bacterium]
MKPKSEAELAELVRESSKPFEIIGTATKRAIGYSVHGTCLDLSGFNTVHAYEPEELILEVGAGALLTDIQKRLHKCHQYFAFEPPDYSALLGGAHSGTIGGMVACNLSGPRRLKAGALRDHILGVRGVSGRGENFKAGARVVKNVTGYDVPKLMAGSYGTLAALTSVIIKVLPKPETEETLFIAGLSDTEAVQAMSLAMQSSCEVSCAAHVPGQGTFLRLEGIAPSVAYRRDKLFQLVGERGEVIDKGSATFWRDIANVTPLQACKGDDIWKISVPPSDAPQVMAKLACDKHSYFDWAGGLIWLAVPQGTDGAVIRAALISGHATLLRSAKREAQHIFQPQPAALAALNSRVKQSFDPQHHFNPGRMERGH